MKNPFTNENSNLYQIYFTTIYIGKRSKASRCEAPKSFYANLLGFLADSSGVGGRGGSP